MTSLFSNTSSRTICFADTLPSTSSHSRKKAIVKPLNPSPVPVPTQKRRTLKLKAKFYDENSTSTLQSLQNKETKKVSMKKRLVGVIEDMAKAKYKPKSSSNEQTFYQSKIRLFDTQKKVNFTFRCFKEEELGYKTEISKLLVGTKQDNDVETDDETLKYYVKKCEKDLV